MDSIGKTTRCIKSNLRFNRQGRRTWAATLILLLSGSVWATNRNVSGVHRDNFDRLDGKGPSGMRVDVIDWKGQMELHIFPASAIKEVKLNIDRTDRNKPVMIIGYYTVEKPHQEITRRALLTMPLQEGFQLYVDRSTEPEYRKFILTNQGLAKSQHVVQLQYAKPRYKFPEGHPMRQDQKRQLAQEPPQPSNVQRTNHSESQERNTHKENQIKHFSW